MDGFHLLERSEWMTLINQLADWPLVESSGNQQDDVVNHVRVPKQTGSSVEQ